jgi:hypothetical protein
MEITENYHTAEDAKDYIKVRWYTIAQLNEGLLPDRGHHAHTNFVFADFLQAMFQLLC